MLEYGDSNSICPGLKKLQRDIYGEIETKRIFGVCGGSGAQSHFIILLGRGITKMYDLFLLYMMYINVSLHYSM